MQTPSRNDPPIRGSQLQVSNELATRLREITRFESVQVIPMSYIGFEGSSALGRTYGEMPFSDRLGALAADSVAYELAFSMLMGTYRRRPSRTPTFRIGIAAGSTVRAIVENFRFPEEFSQKLRATNLAIEVTPLAIGPIPETSSSAGFIASSFANRLQQSLEDVEFVPLSKKLPQDDGYRLSMDPEIRSARDVDPRRMLQEKSKEEFAEFIESSRMRFDWILTGVGSVNSGQLVDHLQLRFPNLDDQREIVTNAVGDICSRIYTQDGKEVKPEDADKFVGISFRWMRYLSNRRTMSGQRSHRVCAVTGGDEKYDAIRALIRNATEDLRGPKRRGGCPFNSLVTDELCARRLIVDLEYELATNERLKSKNEFSGIGEFGADDY